MSRAAEKHSGTAGVVSPPPSLSANGARHRSAANYTQSYGRSSFEQQQLQLQQLQQLHKSRQPLQSAPQETLRRTPSKTGVRGARQVRTPVQSDVMHVSVSDDSEDEESVDISAMTTPAQSFVPEARRRGHPASTSPPPSPPQRINAAALAAAVSAPVERNADKENTNVVVATTTPVASAAAASAGVVAAHSRPTVKATPAAGASASASSSASPAVLYRRTSSSTRGGGANPSGHTPTTTTTTATAPVATMKRTTSLKSRPAAAAAAAASSGSGARRVNAASLSPQKQPQQAMSTPPSSPPHDTRQQAYAAVDPPSPAPRQPAPTTAAAAAATDTDAVDWEVQVQLDRANAVLRYVGEVARALAERRRCGPPPDSTDDFRASVVPCRRRSPVLTTTRPDGGDAMGGGNEGPGRADAPVALLPDLHRTASALLSAFTRLEYAQLSEDIDLPLLESEAVGRCAELRRLVDGVARQLALHESPEVRHCTTQHRPLFLEVHQLVDFVARMAHQVVLLRGIAAHHDFAEAREVLDSFTRGVDIQEEAAERSRGDTSDAQTHAVLRLFAFSPRRLLRESPFFEWLEARWFPTMQAWRQVVLDARQLASTGETDVALRRSRQAALQIAGLHDILRPGETVTSLHHACVVVPITELGDSFAQRRAVLDELRSVMTAESGQMDAAALARAVTAAQAYAQLRSGGRPSRETSDDALPAEGAVGGQVDDAALLRAAKDLLQRVREVQRLRDGVAGLLQTPSPDLTALLENITRVNEMLLEWSLARDDGAARAAVHAGRAVLGRGVEASVCSGRTSADSGASPHLDAHQQLVHDVPPLNFTGLNRTPPPPQPASACRWIGDGFPAGFNVHALYVPHAAPPSTWPADLAVLYRELCDVFAMLFQQRQAQRQLELALGQAPEDSRIGGGSAAAAGFVTPSPQVTPRRPTKDGGTPATAKTTATNRSSEDGSPATLTTARSSGDGVGRGHHHQHGGGSASACELRRRIQAAEEAGVGGALVGDARARLRRLLTLRLKIHFDAQTRVLPIEDAAEADFAEVYEQLHAHCQSQLASSSSSPRSDRRLRVRYEDVDGDFISLLTQQDWDVMVAELQVGEAGSGGGGGGGRVELFCDYPIMPGTPPPQPSTSSMDTAQMPSTNDVAGVASRNTEDDEAANNGATVAATPEKQRDVFARLATSKDVTPNTHAAVGGGGGGNRTPRGRARLGGASPSSSPQQPLIPRNRAAATGGGRPATPSPAKTRPAAAATTAGDVSKSPATKTGTVRRVAGGDSTAAKKASPHTVLTAENLRRNLFRSSPSPPSTEGRRSGGSGSGKKAGKRPSSGDGTAATTAQHPPPPPQQQREEVPSPVAADAALTRVVEKAPPPLPTERSAIRLDVDGARRWTCGGAGGDDDDDALQLLEIQTRASVSTVRMDPFLSSSSFDLAPSPRAATATTRQPLQHATSSSRNNFTTSHCSRTTTAANTATATLESASTEGGNGGGSATSPKVAEKVGAARKVRLSQSPPRRAPRRWTSDDFSLDDVATVCSDRSRVALQPAIPRGPTTLPPRPQTASSPSAAQAANRTPQRGRRGARGTPTRNRPEESGGGEEGEWAESVDDVFAEMQRMREENTRAMGQPRKAAWH